MSQMTEIMRNVEIIPILKTNNIQEYRKEVAHSHIHPDATFYIRQIFGSLFDIPKFWVSDLLLQIFRLKAQKASVHL